MGETVRPTELGGDVSAVVRGTEQPELRHRRAGWRGADFAVLVVGREVVGQPAVEVEQLLGEMVDAQGAGAVDQGAGGASVGARRAADSEIDPTRELGGHGAEVLGHLERAVVGQHDPAGADPDLRGAPGDLRNQDLGRGAGQRARVVVLGEPVARVAQPIAGLGQLEGLVDCRGGGAAVADRDLIEHAKADVGRHGMILQRHRGGPCGFQVFSQLFFGGHAGHDFQCFAGDRASGAFRFFQVFSGFFGPVGSD